jgi:ATP-dependent DNA helicase RecG
MDLNGIKALCKKNGEMRIVEYKTSTANLRAAFETICAFLNGKGGTVLIGVKDDGKIVGLIEQQGKGRSTTWKISAK